MVDGVIKIKVSYGGASFDVSIACDSLAHLGHEKIGEIVMHGIAALMSARGS